MANITEEIPVGDEQLPAIETTQKTLSLSKREIKLLQDLLATELRMSCITRERFLELNDLFNQLTGQNHPRIVEVDDMDTEG